MTRLDQSGVHGLGQNRGIAVARGLDDNTSAFIVLSSQEFGGCLVERLLEGRHAPRRTGAMAPRRLEDAKFGVASRGLRPLSAAGKYMSVLHGITIARASIVCNARVKSPR